MATLSKDELQQARIDLAASFRWAVRHGLHEGICNHFSLAVGDDQFLINPHGSHWSEITASSLLLAHYDGTIIEGDRDVEPTAFYIHSRVHKACPQATCVMHTHMPYATALTLVEGGRLEPVEQGGLRFHGKVAYDDDYNGLALDTSEGDRIAEKMGNCSVMFMAAHGVTVTGSTIARTYDHLYYLERACQAQVIARSTGLPLRRLPDEVIAHTVQQFAQDNTDNAPVHFDALKRILDRDEPDYKD
jgi:ribulose-5-phosphate 4-epimerase/fuculose-1-phosphate aldolase